MSSSFHNTQRKIDRRRRQYHRVRSLSLSNQISQWLPSLSVIIFLHTECSIILSPNKFLHLIGHGIMSHPVHLHASFSQSFNSSSLHIQNKLEVGKSLVEKFSNFSLENLNGFVFIESAEREFSGLPLSN